MPQIRVLVVDDSLFTRRRLVDMLSNDPEIIVIDTAHNGLEALDKVAKLNPDIVTLDIEMAKMDGLTALRHIMKAHPVPVIMVSTLTKEGSESTAQALLEGAVDFIYKPGNMTNINLRNIRDELVAKVKAAAGAKLNGLTHGHRLERIWSKTAISPHSATDKLVMIGSSTGGPRALIEVLPRLPQNFALPIAIVQHMPSGPFIKSIAKRIESESNIKIREARSGDRLEPGLALLAPGGSHMLIEKGGIIKLSNGPSVNSVKPSVDVMMSSGAAVYGSKSIGVILTGMGKDGASGMALIKKKGGRTIVEHESTCVVYGMPKAVIESGNADRIIPLVDIPMEIMKLIEEKD